jgi:hypothetical protein
MGIRAYSLLALALAGCAERGYTVRFEGDPAYESPSGPARGEAEAQEAIRHANQFPHGSLARQLAECDFVFVGRVREVAHTPGFYGTFLMPAPQLVLYEVEETWKGHLPDNGATIGHPIWPRSPTEQGESVALSPAIFRKGAELIVWARLRWEPFCRNYGHYALVCDWDEPGPLPATPALRAEVRRLLESAP